MLLCGEHKDGEDKFGGEKHLNDCECQLGLVLTIESYQNLQSPRTTDVWPDSVVLTAIGPGNSAATTPAAHMPASISAMKTKPARAQEMPPIIASPRATAGLKRPAQHRH